MLLLNRQVRQERQGMLAKSVFQGFLLGALGVLGGSFRFMQANCKVLISDQKSKE